MVAAPPATLYVPLAVHLVVFSTAPLKSSPNGKVPSMLLALESPAFP